MDKRWALAFGVLGMVGASPALADRDTERYSSLTIFGDSLVDAGNFYIASGFKAPDPALGFVDNRFTNGPVYADLLSKDLFNVSTTPSLMGGSNFGFAGARAVDIGDGIPDILAQIGAFQLSGGVIDPNGLYVVNFGGNDVFAAKGVFDAEGGIGTYSDTSSYLQAAAQHYVVGVQALADLGARNIVMTDFPLAGDPFTVEANGYLALAMTGLSLTPDTDLLFYSLSDFNRRVLETPGAFGLPTLRTDTDCIAAKAQGTNCDGFFSFDGVHPTAAVQAAGYREMNQRFHLSGSVPEPASWAMMIAGFGAVGLALRSRRSRVTVALG